jgi:hypothetical protein
MLRAVSLAKECYSMKLCSLSNMTTIDEDFRFLEDQKSYKYFK